MNGETSRSALEENAEIFAPMGERRHDVRAEDAQKNARETNDNWERYWKEVKAGTRKESDIPHS